jgi:uncharacterized protein (DUF433 family)
VTCGSTDRTGYACAKEFAHHQTVNYREAHGLFARNLPRPVQPSYNRVVDGFEFRSVSSSPMPTLTDIGSLITRSRGICGGRVRIAGTGVSVRRIVGWYKLGLTPEKIATEIPHLNLAHVHAALCYYHANRDVMDAEMAAEENEADRLEREHRGSRDKA